MRAYANSAVLLLLSALICVPAAAQRSPANPSAPYQADREQPKLHQSALVTRPITLDEGLAVLGAALDSRHHRGFTSDCSHFVHGLYQRAGFPYTYAPS